MVTATKLEYHFPTWSLPEQPRELKQRLIKLINIMQVIGGSHINSITGLFVQIFAEEKEAHRYQLAIISEKTLYWLSHMRKTEYEFYRTDAEWMGDIGLTRYKLRNLREKLAPIIICQNKHNLARTKIMHYRLDGEALLTAIAKVYGRSTTYIRAILFDRSIEKPHFQTPRPKTLKPDFQKTRENTSKSLTTLPSNALSSKEDKPNTTTQHAGAGDNFFNENSENDFDKNVGTMPALSKSSPEFGGGGASASEGVVDILVKLGIWRNIAKQYDWIPEDALNHMIASAKNKQATGELRSGLPSYLSGVLKNYAQNIREEFKHALAHNPETKFQDFVQKHSVGTLPALSTNEFAGLNWSDVATD